MNDPSSANQQLDAGAVRTVVDLAAHIGRLSADAGAIQQQFETRTRGFFTPSEDDQVLNLWVSYHKSRAALLELLHSVRAKVEQASEEHAGEFAIAYAAALVLIDAARSLRFLFGSNALVRGKLNEAYLLYGIPEGSFAAIQMSLTDPSNALAIKRANEFYDAHRALLVLLATDDDGLGAILSVIDSLRDSTRVPTARYVQARVLDRRRDAHERILLGGVARAVYAIQEWGSRLVSNISTMPSHVPRLPDEIAAKLNVLVQPGDVFVTRKESALTNYFLPGYWPHAAMYVGNSRVIESLKDGVRERAMDSPFGNDAVALIRPQFEPSLLGEAIRRARTHVGKPYDFNFDFTCADRLVCTEVVYRSYDGLGEMRFQLTRRAGRETLSAEDLLNLALRRRMFEPVAIYCPNLRDELLDRDAMTDVLQRTIANPPAGR